MCTSRLTITTDLCTALINAQQQCMQTHRQVTGSAADITFAARCYAQVWPMPSCSICLCLSLYVTSVDSVKMNIHLQKIFLHRVATAF